MGFFNDIFGGEKLGLPSVGSIIGGLTGQSGAEAAREGARLQQEAALAGIDEQRQARESIQQNLSPFLNLGTNNIGELQGLLDPNQQANFVTNNPLFQQLSEDTARRVFSNQAARGKLGSGETANLLGRQLLPIGQQFAQQQFNNLFNTVGLGQNAAALQGTSTQNSANNITDLLGQSGNAAAAGGVGAANSLSEGASNIAGLVGKAASLFSDPRLKTGVKKVGTFKGLNAYEFSYIGSDTVYRGVMADEVLEKNPDAVVEIDGYLAVNYGAL